MDEQEYQCRKSEKEAERRRAEQKKRQLIYERDRLQDAYDSLVNQKGDSQCFQDALKRMPDNFPYWRGQRHEEFLEISEAAYNEACYITYSIDNIMDDMNWKIKQYNDEIHKTNTLIDSIGNFLRSLYTLYHNATN